MAYTLKDDDDDDDQSNNFDIITVIAVAAEVIQTFSDSLLQFIVISAIQQLMIAV
jgi:hypothetical protein